MAIIDLDKIIFKKTIIGITCSGCGGNLKHITEKTITGKIISALTLGKVKGNHYECENCKKHFILI